MIRSEFLGVCLAVALGLPISGATIQPIADLPGNYVPGEPVSFGVRLPEINDLGSYNIDIVLEGSSGAAGVDFYFDIDATGPSPGNYVFPAADYFFAAVNIEAPSRHRITLTDFDFDGVDVLAGANDRTAIVTLNTQPSYQGALTLFVDASSLILDTPALIPARVENFDEIQSAIAAAGPLEVVQVPEPHFLALVLIAMAAAWGRRRRGIDG